jgi:hypothetical protein
MRQAEEDEETLEEGSQQGQPSWGAFYAKIPAEPESP